MNLRLFSLVFRVFAIIFPGIYCMKLTIGMNAVGISNRKKISPIPRTNF